jgi:glucan phosphoethanolaminetransferase (alkaline phosphatase superfamily)
VNTVLIDIDSLRPDHVGAYSYERETTPRIDEFAADAGPAGYRWARDVEKS